MFLLVCPERAGLPAVIQFTSSRLPLAISLTASWPCISWQRPWSCDMFKPLSQSMCQASGCDDNFQFIFRTHTTPHYNWYFYKIYLHTFIYLYNIYCMFVRRAAPGQHTDFEYNQTVGQFSLVLLVGASVPDPQSEHILSVFFGFTRICGFMRVVCLQP